MKKVCNWLRINRKTYDTKVFFENKGYCCICERETVFVASDQWLRDFYKCEICKTIPRNRALVNALNIFVSDWKNFKIHESSPGGSVSDYLKRNCIHYSSSHFYSDTPRGEYKNGYRSEDLTELTFENESFDVFVTSDVFEHVFYPERAFNEIQRVLRPGGYHIFTMPWYPHLEKSVRRTRLREDGSFEFLKDPVYHGNPIGNGSIVTFDWGLDFTDVIFRACNMTTTIYSERDRKKGLDGEFLEVFISRKLIAT